MNKDIKKNNIKNKGKNNEFKFSVKFNDDGEPFQEIMEKIIISRLRDEKIRIKLLDKIIVLML